MAAAPVGATAALLGDLPEGWHLRETTGPLGFTTRARLESPDGSEWEWTSRRHRKGLGLRPEGHLRQPVVWHSLPGATSVVLGVLFGIGSILFALGSVPWYSDAVSGRVLGITFFAGSVFFTSASYVQYREVLVAPEGVTTEARRPSRLRSLVGWIPRRLDWWATAVQFAGTLMFNVTTFASISPSSDVARDRALIWAPDVGGSICFLVASWLAYSEVNRGVWPRSDHSVGWWIAAVNLAGSIAFGVAAVAARYPGNSTDVANPVLVNAGTFVGAACFLAGAVLLPVESSRDRAESASLAFAGSARPGGSGGSDTRARSERP